MAQTGFTPIQLYSSSTATNVPLAANLATGELAINITDGKLFYKDNTAAVQVIGWKVTPTSAGGTGLTSYSQGDLLYYNSGTTLIALAKNTSATRYLSNTGSNNNPAWAQVDLTNGVTGVLPNANTTGATAATANTLLLRDGSGNGTVATLNCSAISNTGNYQQAYGQALNSTTSGGSTSHMMSYQTWSGNANTLVVGNTFGPIAFGTGGGTMTEKARLFTSGGFSLGNTTDPGASNLSVSGNVVIATSGKGIDFSATAGTGTSELLADYEEGTWTPAAGAAMTIVGSATFTGQYTKIGNIVTVWGSVVPTITVSYTGAGVILSGLPFTPIGLVAVGAIANNALTVSSGIVTIPTNANLYSVEAMSATDAIYFQATYHV